jgi:hypothetical protein
MVRNNKFTPYPPYHTRVAKRDDGVWSGIVYIDYSHELHSEKQTYRSKHPENIILKDVT